MTNTERLALIADWTRAGQSASSIAATLGLTPRSITRARVRAGVAQPGPRPIAAATLERARLLIEDGASHAEISRTLGISRRTVARHFPGTGWTAHEATALATAVRAAGQIDR